MKCNICGAPQHPENELTSYEKYVDGDFVQTNVCGIAALLTEANHFLESYKKNYPHVTDTEVLMAEFAASRIAEEKLKSSLR